MFKNLFAKSNLPAFVIVTALAVISLSLIYSGSVAGVTESAPHVSIQLGDARDSSPNHPGDCDKQVSGWGTQVSDSKDADCMQVRIDNPATYTSDFRFCLTVNGATSCTPWASEGGGAGPIASGGTSITSAGAQVQTRPAPANTIFTKVSAGVQLFYKSDSSACTATSGPVFSSNTIPSAWAFGAVDDDDPGCARAHLQVTKTTPTPTPTPTPSLTPTPTPSLTPTPTPSPTVSGSPAPSPSTTPTPTPTLTPTPVATPLPTPVHNTVPFVQTNSAAITTSSAILAGTVNPNGNSTLYYFEYGTATSLGSVTTVRLAGAGTAFEAVSQSVFGLTPGTQYFYRIVAQNVAGTSRGQILSFTTPLDSTPPPTVGQQPAVSTRTATVTSSTSALLFADVNPNGAATSTWFEYGTTTSLGTKTVTQNLGSGNGNLTIALPVINLNSNTTYYYRVGAQNTFGTQYGSTLSFRTTVATTSTQTPAPTATPIRTLTTSTPPATVTPKPTTSTPPVVVSSNGDLACFGLVPTLSPTNPGPNQEFVFAVTYRNGCGEDFNNAVMKLVLPAQAEVKSSNLPYTAENNTLTYNLGALLQNQGASVIVRGVIAGTANTGDTIVFTVLENFTDSQGQNRAMAAYLTDTIGQGAGEVAGAGIIASIFDAFGGWWLWLLLLIVLLTIAFWVYYTASEKKQKEAEYNRLLETKLENIKP